MERRADRPNYLRRYFTVRLYLAFNQQFVQGNLRISAHLPDITTNIWDILPRSPNSPVPPDCGQWTPPFQFLANFSIDFLKTVGKSLWFCSVLFPQRFVDLLAGGLQFGETDRSVL